MPAAGAGGAVADDREAVSLCDLGDMTQAPFAELKGLSLPGAKSRGQQWPAMSARADGLRLPGEVFDRAGQVLFCPARPPLIFDAPALHPFGAAASSVRRSGIPTGETPTMDTLLSSVCRAARRALANWRLTIGGPRAGCLLPAFFIAGRWPRADPHETGYPLPGAKCPQGGVPPGAAAAGSLLAVCSQQPSSLFAGIHGCGAGAGDHLPVFAPAANILALVHTGGIIAALTAPSRASCCRWSSGSVSG